MMETVAAQRSGFSRSLKRKCKTKGRAGENSNKWECRTKKEEEEEFLSCVLQALE